MWKMAEVLGMARELVRKLVQELVQKLGLVRGLVPELTSVRVPGKEMWFNDYAAG